MNKAFKSIASGAAISLFAASLAAAEAPPKPKPGPEHQRLGYFVGQWKGEGEMKPSEWGPGGKVSSTEKCEWFQGGFSVVCHSDGQCPMGPMKSLGIIGYSAEDTAYTYYATDNSGMTMSTVPHGTLQGDTWTYLDDSMMGGKKVKSRVVIKELSPSQYTFAMDMQAPDGKWNRMMESKYTKVK